MPRIGVYIFATTKIDTPSLLPYLQHIALWVLTVLATASRSAKPASSNGSCLGACRSTVSLISPTRNQIALPRSKLSAGIPTATASILIFQ